MSIVVEDLVVGPRGRRFLFELATHPGTSERFTTSEAFAELLGACTIPDLSPLVVRRALEASVDSALYWQQPDGADQLLDLPVMRHALVRIADQVLPHLPDAWTRALAPSEPQVHVELEAELPSRVESPRRPPEESLSRWRWDLTRREAQQAEQLRRHPNEGVSADWWSTPPQDLARTTRVGAADDVPMLGIVEDSFGSQRATCTPAHPGPSRTVLEIDHPEDWIELCRRHPLDVSALRREDWGAPRCVGPARLACPRTGNRWNPPHCPRLPCRRRP